MWNVCGGGGGDVGYVVCGGERMGVYVAWKREYGGYLVFVCGREDVV